MSQPISVQDNSFLLILIIPPIRVAELTPHAVALATLPRKLLLLLRVLAPKFLHGSIGSDVQSYGRVHLPVQEQGLPIIAGYFPVCGIKVIVGRHEFIQFPFQQQGREVIIQGSMVTRFLLADAAEELQGRFAHGRTVA